MLAIIADGLRVRSSMGDITKAHPWAAPHRFVSREKTTTTLLDKRRIRVDRNKNKLSANYCVVRFAEITPVSRSAARAPRVRPPPDVRGWRHCAAAPRAAPVTVTSSLPRLQRAPRPRPENRRCTWRNGRLPKLWAKIWLYAVVRAGCGSVIRGGPGQRGLSVPECPVSRVRTPAWAWSESSADTRTTLAMQLVLATCLLLFAATFGPTAGM